MSETVSGRQRILDAALAIFVRKGYDEVGIEEIALAAGTQRGALLFHFPSRERIFLALMDRFADSVERKLLAVIEEQGQGMLQVEAAWNACLEAFAKHWRQTKILLSPAAALGAPFQDKQYEIRTRFSRHIQNFLDEAIALEQIPAVDTEVIAAAWIGAIHHLIMTWIRAGEPNRERIAASLVPMLLNSVQYRPDGKRSASG